MKNFWYISLFLYL